MKADTRSSELLTILCAATLLISSVSFAALFNRDKAAPFVLKFYVAFNEGADCPRLFELRNDAKRQGADNEQQKTMNEKLRSVGCIGDTSKRVPVGPPNTGDFTVKEYKIYHEVVTTPMSVEEPESWAAAGFTDTELGVWMKPEVHHGTTEVYARVQA